MFTRIQGRASARAETQPKNPASWRTHRAVAVVAIAAVGLALAGCGGGSSTPSSPASAPAASATQASSAPAGPKLSDENTCADWRQASTAQQAAYAYGSTDLASRVTKDCERAPSDEQLGDALDAVCQHADNAEERSTCAG